MNAPENVVALCLTCGSPCMYDNDKRPHHPACDHWQPRPEPKEINLNGEFDAKKWAQEFMRLFKQNGADWIDEGLMIGWFANAIMSGYDNANWKRDKDKPKEQQVDMTVDMAIKSMKQNEKQMQEDWRKKWEEARHKMSLMRMYFLNNGIYEPLQFESAYELALTAAAKRIEELEKKE